MSPNIITSAERIVRILSWKKRIFFELNKFLWENRLKVGDALDLDWPTFWMSDLYVGGFVCFCFEIGFFV